MKLTNTPTLLGALVPLTAAFPSWVFEEAANDPQIAARADEILKPQEGAGARRPAAPGRNVQVLPEGS